jgi:hypothetical protein
MTWTEELPKQPGFYWTRHGNEDSEPNVLEVVRMDHGLEVF